MKNLDDNIFKFYNRETKPGEEKNIERIDKEELEIFKDLYLEYYASLCIYANNFTRSKDISEEIVQDVFIGLWEKRKFVKINKSISSYLFISVRNTCLNHLKHLQIVNRFNHEYSRMLKEAQDYYCISQDEGYSHLIAKELQEKIDKEIEQLPPACRKIFLLSRRDNLKHQEIAAKLGININTVHRQVSIAIEKIRKGIEKFMIIALTLTGLFS